MITPDEIRQKAERQYLTFLQTWLRQEPFTPVSLPVGKLPSNYNQLRQEVQHLQAGSKIMQGYGYALEFQVQQKRSLGTQTLPTRVVIETVDDYLHLIGKKEEFQHFQNDVGLIREQLPQLAVWMERSPRKVIEQHGIWPELLSICRYFLEHPRPGLYIRELPLNVHTKFIEQHSGIIRELLEQILPEETMTQNAQTFSQRFGLREEDPLIRIRFLDNQLEKSYALPLDELAAPCTQLTRLKFIGQRCIITENKMTFLTLPQLPETLAILGEGFKVRLLSRLTWLRECPIFYWGDLDAQGFQILSLLRSIFPHVVSLMMDEETLETFSEFCVKGTPCQVQQLPHLTEEEHALFVRLARENARLEQERIAYGYALERVREKKRGRRQTG